jgi:transcriptional regulator with XRE-family HTH domain
MGYAGKLEEKELAIKLRKKGLSYSEILGKVPVSKDTISRWCRDVILNPEQLERLQKRKILGSERGRFIGAKKQQQMRIQRTKKLMRQGISDVGKLSERDRFMAGVGLYMGDGYKSDKSVGFSNSNPKLIKFMMLWFRDFCKVPETKFRGQIWIHENLSEYKARQYWSKKTGIPLKQFQKSYIAMNKGSSRKVRKQLHRKGVFAIRISSAETQRKILGWFAGVLGEPLV